MLPTPALLNITSRLPNCSTARSTAACTSSAFAHVDPSERHHVTEVGGELLAPPLVDVGDDDARAFGDEAFDRRSADAARAAGHDRDLAREFVPHDQMPFSIHWSGHGFTPCRMKICVDGVAVVRVERPVECSGVVVDLGHGPAPDE